MIVDAEERIRAFPAAARRAGHRGMVVPDPVEVVRYTSRTLDGARRDRRVVPSAAVGAPARYLTDLLVQSRHDSVFPWGTFTVNVVGSFVLARSAARGAGAGRADLVLTWSAPASAVR